MNSSATARAFANVALVKYFGKRDAGLNLPDAPSLSMTLSPLQTLTTLTFDETAAEDKIFINDEPADPAFARRVSSFLDISRKLTGTDTRATVKTSNTFPTAAGLASSASGFAALALAVNKTLNLNLDTTGLSALARRGSGSAARSIKGGFVKWDRGTLDDGSDSVAAQLKNSSYWDLRILVGVAQHKKKPVGSTKAMNLTKETSPYYRQWINSATQAVDEACDAIIKKDFTMLGEITEHSALAMHGALMASKPGIIFFKGATIETYHMVQQLRKDGIEAYFTCDAGPQPKILCQAADINKIAANLQMIPQIKKVIPCSPGDDARIIEPYGSNITDTCST